MDATNIMNKEISIVVPVYNEENNLYELYERTLQVISSLTITYEIIFVDDGSHDHSFQVIKRIASENVNVKYIRFTRNFGHQAALFAGIEKTNGNAIVLIDGDLQDPPEEIRQLWTTLQNGYDVVYAKRNSRDGESVLKKFSAALFYRILNKITHFNIPLDTGDFRIFNKRVAKELLEMKDHTKFLRGQIAWLGFKEHFIHYNRDKRKKGKSGFGFSTMIRFAIDGITGFSNFPLKFASISGLIVSVFSFLMIIYVLLAKFLWHETIQGWTSIMLTILFLGGIQLLSIGIIGEYISRINDGVRNRKLYIIDQTNIQ